MLSAALVLAVLAGLLHVWIFVLESVLWTRPAALKTFGTTPEEAAATREMAFNQGFYNLFLGLAAIIGAGAWWAGATTIGLTLAVVGIGSMFLAALVLFCSSPDKRGAAAKQGALPLAGLLLLGLAALV